MLKKWVWGVLGVVFLCSQFLEAHAATNEEEGEKFFMSRARWAANLTCTKRNQPKKFQRCYDQQMAAAKRIVKYTKSGNSEKRFNKTMKCLQAVQVLPKKQRLGGLTWVEKCIRK